MRQQYERGELRLAFSRCVRKLRREKGISQEQLAADAGIDRGYMGALERGVNSPTIEMIYRLLPALGVTFAEFAEVFDQCLRCVRRKNAK